MRDNCEDDALCFFLFEKPIIDPVEYQPLIIPIQSTTCRRTNAPTFLQRFGQGLVSNIACEDMHRLEERKKARRP